MIRTKLAVAAAAFAAGGFLEGHAFAASPPGPREEREAREREAAAVWVTTDAALVEGCVARSWAPLECVASD